MDMQPPCTTVKLLSPPLSTPNEPPRCRRRRTVTGVAAPISPGAASLTLNVVEPSGGTAARNATSTVEHQQRSSPALPAAPAPPSLRCPSQSSPSYESRSGRRVSAPSAPHADLGCGPRPLPAARQHPAAHLAHATAAEHPPSPGHGPAQASVPRCALPPQSHS